MACQGMLGGSAAGQGAVLGCWGTSGGCPVGRGAAPAPHAAAQPCGPAAPGGCSPRCSRRCPRCAGTAGTAGVRGALAAPRACHPLLTQHSQSAGSRCSSRPQEGPGGRDVGMSRMAWLHPSRGVPMGNPLHPISPHPNFCPTSSRQRPGGQESSQPRALTACSVSASWAHSRMMSWLAEKSLRVENRYLGGRQSSASGVGGTQHPGVPSPAPDLLSQEKSSLAAPTRSMTRARRVREGGWGTSPADSPACTRLWMPCASSCSLSVSVLRLVLASPVSWGEQGCQGMDGQGGLQGATFTQPTVPSCPSLCPAQGLLRTPLQGESKVPLCPHLHPEQADPIWPLPPSPG